LSTSSDWFISVPQLLADTDPAESGQYSLGELQSNELFVVSFRFTLHQRRMLGNPLFSPSHERVIPRFLLVAN
jgi:hypothetical protein